MKALGAALRHRLRKSHPRPDTQRGTRYHAQTDPQVWRKTMSWIVDSSGVGDGVAALRYLARYVSKTALSEPRLLGYDAAGKVRLNCQSSATGQWGASSHSRRMSF